MNAFEKQLRSHFKGDLRFDALSRKIYSVDASIFEVEPLGVALPKDKQDMIALLQMAKEHNIAVIPRGAATGMTGGCLGQGIIVDVSKYLNQILDIHIEKEYAICEPGVVQEQLNLALHSFGYRLGPDTSTGNRATLGGMLANDAAGARSLHYGKMVDCVESVELLLTGGDILFCELLDAAKWQEKMHIQDREGHIYKEMQRLLHQYGPLIHKHFPSIPRHVSGYHLDRLHMPNQAINLSKIIAGSEGTLGIASEIKVKIAKTLKNTVLCVVHVFDMIEALQGIEEMLSFHPVSLEMIDDHILHMARLSPVIKNKLAWLIGEPKAVFVAEFADDDPKALNNMVNRFKEKMESLSIGYAHVILRSSEQMSHVWEVRKAGVGLLLSKRTYSRAIAFIEDLSVAPKHLAPFLQQLTGYLKSKGHDVGIYGHVGSGCMHIRPFVNLRKKSDVEQISSIMTEVADMILHYGGSLSGEHGDGLIRSWLNKKMFGSELYAAFVDLKTAFDPHALMNPGKIVHASPIVQETLRMHPAIEQVKIPTFLDFSQEGGIELAADLCNGNGQCRKSNSVMCPSFQATGDEYDTTRARAQSLRAIINGRLPQEEFTGRALYDVLDLCLECKGCKTQCPSQVDMAKMKAEFLYQYQEKHGVLLRNRLFGHIAALNRLSAPLAGLFNALSRTKVAKLLLNCLGVTSQRQLPPLARKRFSTWFYKQRPISKKEKAVKKIVLFSDTYTEFNHPEIGISAYKVFCAMDYEVVLVSNLCCGRPLISKGLLKQAKTKAIALIKALSPFAQTGIPIICLEPSCLSAIRDDYKNFTSSLEANLATQLKIVAKMTFSFEEFLHSHLFDGKLPLPFEHKEAQVFVHGHCHQKVLEGMKPTLEVLHAIPGVFVKEIESGCCGMAGSFGYEKEHYALSMQIGNLKLLPAVRELAPSALIVANGTSCRAQIQHGTEAKAYHIAQVIESFLSAPTRGE